jgi:hypothetical protein
MKMVHLTTLSVVTVLLTAVSAMAQNAPQLTMPSSVQPTAYDYDSYAAAEPAVPAEKAAPAPATAAAATASDNGSQEPCNDEKPCRWCMKGKLADPWTLPQPNILKENNVTVGGWLSGGIYGNQYGATNNGPLGFRTIGDGFTADQLCIFAERKTDTKGCGWDIGGRVDFLYGVDGQDIQAFGDRTWDYGWDSSSAYGSAIPQAYTEIAYNDVSVKLGRFYTPIGYEVFGNAKLLLLAFVHVVLCRAVHPHRCVGDLQTQ